MPGRGEARREPVERRGEEGLGIIVGGEPDTDRDALRRIAEALAQRQHVHEDLYNYRKDGRGLGVALEVKPVFDEDGSLRFFFGSQVDITRRRETELLQDRHIESIRALSKDVAHEFDNLMTVVTGSVAQALKQAGDPRQHQRLERAAWAAQRAGEQALRLLDLAQRQSAAGSPIDLNIALQRRHDTMLQLAGPDVPVVLNLAAMPVVAKLHTGQFERVVLALVRNAAEATPQGGAVTIATSATGIPGDTTTVQIAVSDQGSGMPPKIAARATEAFFTTKGAHAATGLGFFLALGFAEQAGGRLAIKSEPGRGTKVTLVLPSAADALLLD